MYKKLISLSLVFYCVNALSQAGKPDKNFGSNGVNYTNIIDINPAYQRRNVLTAIQPDGKILITGITANGSVIFRYNIDGKPDNTFNGNGKAFISNSLEVLSIIIQNDGKIIVAGSSKKIGQSSDTDFSLIRYKEDGSVDSSFGSNGRVFTSLGDREDGVLSMAIQNDGKIIAAGYGSRYLAVVRYNTNGSLDSSFDGDGRVTILIESYLDVANSVAIQADGKIVAAGTTRNTNTTHFGLARFNTDGSLDSSFDGDGKVVTAVRPYRDELYAMAIQADGKIVAAGKSSNSFFYDLALVRYKTNGSIDSSFGNNGKYITAIGYSETVLNSMAIQSDGKIVACGYCYQDWYKGDFLLMRFDPNGNPDNSFNGNGYITTTFGPTYAMATSMAIRNDGKIVLTGHSAQPNGINFAVTCHNPDASLDTNFNTNGKLLISLGASKDAVTSMAVQSDGKMIVAGSSVDRNNKTVFALSRFKLDGSIDAKFDYDGKLTSAIGSTEDRANAVAIQSDGKIVAAGYSIDGNRTYFALARYNIDGSLDSSFDGDGKLTTAIGSLNDRINAMAIQADGKIVVAGFSYVNSVPHFALARYNVNGTLDASFDGDGKIITVVGGKDQVNAMIIQPDGKIVVGGHAYTTGNNSLFALARYKINGSPDTDFETDGKVITPLSSGPSSITSIALQEDGKIVATGYCYPGSGANIDFALVRYNTNGDPDISFDGDGRVTAAIGPGEDRPNAVAIQSDGKIVVAGYSFNGNNYDFVLTRFNTNGKFDHSFDNDGRTALDLFEGGNEYATCMKLQANRIYLAGTIEIDGEDDFGIMSVINDVFTSPLSLLSFSGKLVNNDGLLEWKTENEINTLEFIVERSIDGRNYTPVGKTNAINTPGYHQYYFTDPGIVSLGVKVIYYRLLSKKIDGTITYSRIVALSIENKSFVLFYPNPVITDAGVTITIDRPDLVQERIFDNNGRLIRQGQLNLQAGSTSLIISLSHLAKGIYYLELKGKVLNKKIKFVKL